MKIYLKNFFTTVALFLLPVINFIQYNFNLIDINILSNLFFINLICYSLILILSYLTSLFSVKKIFFSSFVYLTLIYNIIFYFEKIKLFYLNYTSIAFYLSIITILILSLLILKIFKNKIIYRFIIIYFSLSYLSFIFFIFLFNSHNDRDIANFDNNKAQIFKEEKIINDTKDEKNIYVIIMDGMTSLDYANKILNINSKRHLQFLNKKNYDYYDSRSNYNTTYLTMAAILQLDYVVKPNSSRYFDRYNFWPYLLGKKEKDTNLIKILKDNNYNFKWFGNITASCKNYSYDKNFCPPNEVNSTYYVFNSFFSSTPIITILRKFFPKVMLGYYGNKVDAISNFTKLNKIYKKNFTLIHHLSPHPPYIHNADCSIKKQTNTSITSEDSFGYKDSYLCSLKKIEELIEFLDKKDPGALVMISADHGWNINRNMSNDDEYEKIKEKTIIYNSIKIDEKCKKEMPEFFDNINSMRLIIGCAINKKPIFTKSEIFYGYQEENKEKFGKIYKLNLDLKNFKK